MKNLKITSLLLLVGIFTSSLVFAQNLNPNKNLMQTEFADHDFQMVHSLLDYGLSLNGGPVPPKAFENCLKQLEKYIANNLISEAQLSMVFLTLDAQDNGNSIYNTIIATGYSASSPLSIKAKQYIDNKNTPSTEFTEFRAEYITWKGNLNTTLENR